MEQVEQGLLIFIRQVYELMSWPGVVVLMAIESACIPLPSEIIMPLSGWMLIKERGLGASYTLVAGFYGALGCAIGSALAYWIGRYGGRPLAEKYGRYVLLSHGDLDLADRWFSKYGDWVVFLSRLLPVVRTFISLPAGIARMNFPKFLIYTFLGSFPWCLGLAYAGYQLGEHWEQVREAIRPFDVLLGLYVYRRVRR
jgi:membrane protein DedA with SNARE-associated domain